MTVYEDLEGSNCSFDEDEEFGHEALPFALNEESTIEEMRPLHAKVLECSVDSRRVVAAASTVVQSMETVSLAHSTLSQPPPLMSSVLTTDSSLASTMMSDQWGGESGTGTNLLSSRHLDAAASLMASMAGNGLQMSMTPVQRTSSSTLIQPLPNPVNPESPYSRLGFSRLLQNAGDGSEIVGAGLPVLHEEEADSFHSARESPFSEPSPSSFPSNISTTTSQVMGAPSGWVPIIDEPSRGSYNPPVLDSSLQNQPQPNHRQPLARERVYARQLDPASFEISIDVAPDLSMEDVMEVLGNPSYLVLWCESIRSLVVTNISEGGTAQPQKSTQVRAVHEGHWIEASTTDLIAPPSSSSCLYSTSKAVWNYVGFPSHYGNVSMFVERPKGRVGLSIGPFPGDITVSHSIQVDPRANRIVDTVTLSRNSPSNGGDLLCGVRECLESCFLPSNRGYMDQAVDSMVRLRALVETGEGCSQQEGFELIHSQRQLVY